MPALDYTAGNISIHALRKECDFRPDYSTNADGDISIHALRKECDGLL